MKTRIHQLQQNFNEYNVDALLIENLINVYYLSSFTGTAASLLITKTKQYLLVDHRYILQAKQQANDFDVVVYDQSFDDFMVKVNTIVKSEHVDTMGIDGATTTYDRVMQVKEACDASVVSIDVSDLRTCKDEHELTLLKQAIAIGDDVFLKVYPQITPGLKESDVVDMLYKELKAANATDFSFDVIVASGHRSSMPHGVASDKLIEANDIVTIDWGVKANRYCSDCTRTFFMSKPKNKQLIDMYNAVLHANKQAIAAVKAGVSSKEVDRVARQVIEEAGYIEYFNHGTGHGLGLEIHEHPRLNTYSDVPLKENMVITIEPGIYIEGVGGVRIEDVVVVTKDGCEVLTKLNKDLQYKTEGSNTL